MSKVSNVWRWGLALLLASLVFFLAAQPRAQAADARWRARYFNNRNVSGDPVFRRDEDNVDHDWGNGGPGNGVSSDNFSARWTRRVNFSGGTYRFYATMDDGMRLWVDGRLLIDDWNDSQVRTRTADIYLAPGDHDLEVHYYEAGGVAVAKVSWTAVGGQPPSAGAWAGEYFSNRDLSGGPVLVRNDAAIDFNWGGGSPGGGVPTDNFSARWIRNASFPGGTYRFSATMDDGMRVWVDNRLVIDDWREAAVRTRTADLELAPGSHRVEVRYFEAGGQAVARFGWSQISGQIPPAGAANWFGEYFNNQSLAGFPTFTRGDNAVAFNWGSGSPGPGIANDHFSVRWTQTIAAQPGTYRLTATADDGIRVWVNNQILIDEWRENQNRTWQREVTLPGGLTPLRVEYYENMGTAKVNVSFTLISGGGVLPTPQPPSILPPGPGQAVVANASWLNLRSTPEVADNIITALPRGQVVTMLGRSGSWVKVVMPERNNLTGWVSGRYLETIHPVGDLPTLSE